MEEKCLVSSRATKIKNTAIGKQTATCGAITIGSGSVVSEERVAAFTLSNCRSPYVWERQLGTGTNCPPSCSLVPVTILAASTFSIPHPQTGREEPKVQRLMTEETAPTEGLRMCVFERGRWGHCHLLQRGGWKRRKGRKAIILLCPSTRSTSFKAKWVFGACVKEIDSFWCVD